MAFISEYDHKCGKCGQVIKAGTPFVYMTKKDGKPTIIRVHACCVRSKDGTSRESNK